MLSAIALLHLISAGMRLQATHFLKKEVGHPLVVQSPVPAQRDVISRLRLLHAPEGEGGSKHGARRNRGEHVRSNDLSAVLKETVEHVRGSNASQRLLSNVIPFTTAFHS